jgi:hypothetical protein
VLFQLKRSQQFVRDLEDVSFFVRRIDVGVSGLGLAIPAVTVRLFIGDGLKRCASSTVARIEDEHPDKMQSEEAPPKTDAACSSEPQSAGILAKARDAIYSGLGAVGSGIGSVGAAVKGLVTSPKSKTSLQRLCESLQDLEEDLSRAGLLCGRAPGDAWIIVTIGTFVGLTVAVTPRTALSAKDQKSLEDRLAKLCKRQADDTLSVLQRMISGTIKGAASLGEAIAGKSLVVHTVSLSISGLGLAIPSISTSISLGRHPDFPSGTSSQDSDTPANKTSSAQADVPNPSAQENMDEPVEPLADMEFEILECDKENPSPVSLSSSTSVSLSSSSPNFVLGAFQSLISSASHSIQAISVATLQACSATGQAATRVLEAASDALSEAGRLFGDAALAPARSLVRLGQRSGHRLSDRLPLHLSEPGWLDVTFGTVFGLGLSFEADQRVTLRQLTLENSSTSSAAQASPTSKSDQPEPSDATLEPVHPDVVVADQAKASEQTQSPEHGRLQSMQERALQHAVGVLESSRRVSSLIKDQQAKIGSVSIFLSNLGIGTPIAAGTIGIDRLSSADADAVKEKQKQRADVRKEAS